MKVLDLGVTGLIVADNVKNRRTEANLTYAALEKRLEEAGHRIPSLGLRRIEAGARRVDVDELVALSVALNCTPIDLLRSRMAAEKLGTAVPEDIHRFEFWAWLKGTLASFSDKDRYMYWRDSLPIAQASIKRGEERLERIEASSGPNKEKQLALARLNLEWLRERETTAFEMMQRFAHEATDEVPRPWMWDNDND